MLVTTCDTIALRFISENFGLNHSERVSTGTEFQHRESSRKLCLISKVATSFLLLELRNGTDRYQFFHPFSWEMEHAISINFDWLNIHR